MSKRSRNKRNRRKRALTNPSTAGRGDGSPIETRCQARGLVTVNRKKEAARRACRGKVTS